MKNCSKEEKASTCNVNKSPSPPACEERPPASNPQNCSDDLEKVAKNLIPNPLCQMSDEELEEAGVNGTTAAESPTPPEHATRKRKAKVPERKVDAKKKKGQTKKNPEAGLSNI